jgi:hypothetical protein
VQLIPITAYQQIAGGQIDDFENKRQGILIAYSIKIDPTAISEEQADCYSSIEKNLAQKARYIEVIQSLEETAKPIQVWAEKIRSGEAYNMKFGQVL